jgi:hypothetical protein
MADIRIDLEHEIRGPRRKPLAEPLDAREVDVVLLPQNESTGPSIASATSIGAGTGLCPSKPSGKA